MNLISANLEHLDQIYALVQDTIQSVYPKYYPLEVVDFFCAHHCKENIEKDIIAGTVFLMLDGSVVIGTASYYKYHITRLYVNHTYQGKGYGTYLMQSIEQEIAKNYSKVSLDASLPAVHLYESLGYRTVSHEKYPVDNDAILVYEIMEKELIPMN